MKKTPIFLLLSLITLVSYSQDKIQFQTPPNAAKPRVWWHWMNGNVTKDGIQKDLDWFSRVGIGGFQNFDANLFTPVVVPNKLIFMTPEWKDAFKFTTELADKKGLEMAIAGSPGWSVTGGPWVEPKDAMKKYVWTETTIEGGKAGSVKLPQPSGVVGKFQDVIIQDGGISGEFIGTKPNFYQDAFVVAYRLPSTEKTLSALNPKISSSGGTFTVNDLIDNDLLKSFALPAIAIGEDMWIQYEFENPQVFKAFSVAGASIDPLGEFNGNPENRTLKVSDDGINFREIAKVSGSTVPYNTVAFAPISAKYWRMCWKTLAPAFNPMFAMMGMSAKKDPDGVSVAEFVLHSSSRIDKFEDKAGFSPWRESAELGIRNDELRMTDAILSEDVIDLTSFMQVDGTLNWTPPSGGQGAAWQIIRLGYSLTGRQNHPASPEATGLEVDKLDKDAVRKYINTYLDMYKDATGGLMGEKGLQYMILDSYEAGHNTWTKAMSEEFKKRRGYDLVKWIPVLTGRVVKDVASSEKFLWDFRKNIGEMIAENHYDVIGEELHKRGMKRYTESHEDKRIYLADGMDVKRNADIPMSAMWTPGSLGGSTSEEVRSEGDIRESASVANIYGKRIVAAESMTSVGRAFQEYPERLKRTADLEMASGLNRFVIHTSVHQPLDDKKPGFSLGPFGQYFTRHETWAEQAKPWMDYLGRSCHLLQQGKNVADILYLYGENTNITWITREKLPNIPTGYEFDFVNSTALIEAIEAKNGKLIAKSGNTYEVLMLDESAKLMTLSVLKKIKILADAGVEIIGSKPEKSPSLSDDDAEFQKIANEIWAKSNVGTNYYMPTTPDVIISGTSNKILFRHRKSEILNPKSQIDVYWLNNRSENPTDAEISFRISGKIPELWNPETGKTESVSYQIKDGRTIVPLNFKSWDAFFIVFNKDANNALTYSKPKTTETLLSTISTPWKVSFNDKVTTMSKLNSWSENTDTDIKYFSGTATYSNTFQIKTNTERGRSIIDLGEVKNIAEVFLNGKSQGIAWKKPFVVELKDLKKGENSLEIKVANLWVNRLIGDAQPDVKTKTTFTTMPFYQANSPLLPSGLLSEVKLLLQK